VEYENCSDLQTNLDAGERRKFRILYKSWLNVAEIGEQVKLLIGIGVTIVLSDTLH